ncbi:MAG: hypothetical protein JNM20_13735 [Rhizobiales bacterium]|nr:hypothetical protein [Hyphomicrobiales bacterium]
MTFLRCAASMGLLRRFGDIAAAMLLFVLLFVLLASCGAGGGSKPFAKIDGSPNGRPAPPITLVSVSGLPSDKSQVLKDALAVSAGKRDMAIVDGSFDSGTFGLSGQFSLQPLGAEVGLAYRWTLTDQNGKVLHTISASERAPATGADPWAAITPVVLGRVAAYTAENISSRLSQLGYATQIGGVPPPVDSFAQALPGAEKDIDYETVLGPGRGDTAVLAAASPVPDPHTQLVGPPEPMPHNAMADDQLGSPTASVEARKPKPAKPDYEIKAVAVLTVKGSPGDGNAELTEAMRRTLKTAGWPVITAPRGDALTVNGKVRVEKPFGNSQRVSLDWTVSAPNGKVLGVISQSNLVPAGSIDAGFGAAALQVAEAAALGIFDVVKKLR